MKKTKKKENYRVTSHVFKGSEKYESGAEYYTYEITFNKSLGHTGRFTGIENGLNEYCKKEVRENVLISFKNFWESLIVLFKFK